MPRAYRCRLCKITTPVLPRRSETCPGCNRFTVAEAISVEDMEGAEIAPPIDGQVISLQDAQDGSVDIPRILSGVTGFDQLLGSPDNPEGGIVPSASYILCGSPGSGKSTLLLQVLRELARRRHDVLYV